MPVATTLHALAGEARGEDHPPSSWRRAIRSGASLGAAFGLFEGALVALGVDPALVVYEARVLGLGAALARDLPGPDELGALLRCVLAAVASFALLGGLGAVAIRGAGSLLGLALRRARGTPIDVGVVVCALGTWLELAWWARPFCWPEAPISDPRRLTALALLALPATFLAVVAARVWRSRSWSTRRAVHIVTALAIAAGAWFALGGKVATARHGEVGAHNEDQPNVLLVVVDALRYDALTHERASGPSEFIALQTPHLDALARDGTTFERALAHAPFTWPSFGSLLTGKLPRRHGLVRMSAEASLPENATLGELLEGPRAGAPSGAPNEAETTWLCAAFMTGALSHGSGLLRGFDVYTEAMAGRGLVDAHDRWSTFRAQLLPWLVATKIMQHTREESVAQRAAEWLERHGDRRFFAFVHLYATHTPYDPPPELRARHGDPSYRGPFTTFDAADRRAIERGERHPTAADVAQIRALYAACVEEVDRDLGALLQALERARIAEHTLVIVTADHGESLGERGLFEHGWMTQENLRVPLLLRWPQRVPRGLRVAARVEHVDVLPTVLDLAGVAAPPSAAYWSEPEGAAAVDRAALLDGVSLVPLLRTPREAPESIERPVTYAEDGVLRSAQNDRVKVVVGARGWPFEAAGAAVPDTLVSPRYAVFDLVADPGERSPLVFAARPSSTGGTAPSQAALAVIEALHALEDRIPERSPAPAPRASQSATEARLRELGYAGSNER